MKRTGFLLLSLVALAVAAPPRDIGGRWAMSWQTRSHGIRQSGSLIIKQKGAALDVVLTGDGELHATGSVDGSQFHIEGRRMLMRYTIDGSVDPEQVMHGVLRVATVVKPFTAKRD